MKKLFFVLLTACLLCVAGCQKKDEPVVVGGNDNVQIPNPMKEHATLQEASEYAGFSLVAPVADGFKAADILTIDNDNGYIIEARSYAGETELTVRKAVGDGDISGDYTDYEKTTNEKVGKYNVTFKGSNDGMSLAVWTYDGYTYCVYCDGVKLDTVKSFIQSIE